VGHPQERTVFQLRPVRFRDPDRTESDVYARYQVRVEELRQSARIVKQALEGMPEGPWKADAPHVVLPDREKMKTQMEALIYHFKIVTEGFRVPAGDVYQVVESPRGEMGYYVVSDGTAKPYRVFIHAPVSGTCKGCRRWWKAGWWPTRSRRWDRRISCWETWTDEGRWPMADGPVLCSDFVLGDVDRWDKALLAADERR